MPPTKAKGEKKQNRRGRPTTTPLSSRGTRVWYDSDGRQSGGTVSWGAYSGRNLAGGGFDTLAELRWADLIGPSIPAEKINHTTINCRGSLYVQRLAVGRNGGPIYGDRN